jgi:hypothetical protein
VCCVSMVTACAKAAFLWFACLGCESGASVSKTGWVMRGNTASHTGAGDSRAWRLSQALFTRCVPCTAVPAGSLFVLLKIQEKLSLLLHEMWGSGGVAPFFLDFGTRRR